MLLLDEDGTIRIGFQMVVVDYNKKERAKSSSTEIVMFYWQFIVLLYIIKVFLLWLLVGVVKKHWEEAKESHKVVMCVKTFRFWGFQWLIAYELEVRWWF